MDTLWLHLQAPFAAFRWMQAGVYRATSPVIPPSAAWGLVLNLAGIETRLWGGAETTQVRPDAPPLRLAIGRVRAAEVGTLFQQLHGYPVGSSGKELAPKAFGSKYWIAPARREVLVGLDCVVGVQALEPGLLDLVRRGLAGELTQDRYGLPFAGDNNFLFDRIDVVQTPPPAHWFARLAADDGPAPGSCRLTVGIDRADSSRTTNVLFAPTPVATVEPPESAWTWTPRMGVASSRGYIDGCPGAEDSA